MTGILLQIPPFAEGQRLLDWLIAAGYPLPAPCGGRGVCGKCRVEVVDGTFFSVADPQAPLVPAPDGSILACRALCGKGGCIRLPALTGTGLADFKAPGRERGDPDIAGHADAGPVAVSASHAALPGEAPALGEGIALPGEAPATGAYGVALDVGTTTVAAALVEQGSGRVLATHTCPNPQAAFGADVMSRISAAGRGDLPRMQALILDAVRGILVHFAAAHPDARPDRLAVTGNTTMLHLFCGVSPVGMGAYPFTPAFTDRRTLPGDVLDLPVREVTVLPSASAFIGADVVCGILVTGTGTGDDPALLIDIGTNGELALYTGRARGGALYTASAAAGPALEGASIECGVGGVPGAISRVRLLRGRPVFSTVENAPPCGLCGSGLVDLAAELLDTGVIDEGGYMENTPYRLCGMQVGEDGRAIAALPPTLTLTQRDVRELQLAKSAIAAGISALLAHAGIGAEELQRVYIAGGLGYYLDMGSAARIGLLPAALAARAESVGNSALAGAATVIRDPAAADRLDRIARAAQSIELNQSEVFNAAFIEGMALCPQG